MPVLIAVQSAAMLRRIFTIASVLSLLLCVAVALLWVRSYWISDGFILARHENLSYGRCVRGHIGIISVYGIANSGGFQRVQWKYLFDDPHHRAPGAFSSGFSRSHHNLHFPGFVAIAGTQYYAVRESPPLLTFPSRYIEIPFWLPCLITAWPLCPLIIRGLKRIRFRHPPGTCRRCGYDLRASTDRCPECGTPIATIMDN